MNKADIFSALTAYLDTHGGPGALKDFFAEYERSLGKPPEPFVDTLVVLSDGETWDSRAACSFVDVTEEERTEIVEGRKITNVVDKWRWRPVHDTKEVWVMSDNDEPPYKVFRSGTDAMSHRDKADPNGSYTIHHVPLSDD